MGIRIEIDAAPAYELYPSLLAYLGKDKSLDRGPSWARQVRKGLDKELAEDLKSLGKPVAFSEPKRKFSDNPLFQLIWLLPPLIRDCPEDRSVSGFLRWLEGLSSGELYERAAERLPEGMFLPAGIGVVRDRAVSLLRRWDRQYLSRLDSAVWEHLQRDAERKRRRFDSLKPVELIEEATNGLWLSPAEKDVTVLLVPQVHCVPANLYERYKDLLFIQYPCELPSGEGNPPTSLLRMARSLADKNRLRILRYLSGGPRSFMEIVRHTGLAKSTVHHHMVSLRSAGLVRMMLEKERNEARYALRREVPDRLHGLLAEYLKGENRPSDPP
ncbi:DNA-binding transcriptional regulator, ArsR family [Planifilum fulgidum]|jgi:DNA-binding transcriptional ArsR family regulator|uniref:DNA-binding transcriptional regulator, ArsR family n=1 Tax=Planifilum fulgidum TaxID=201973 RepID=A0A1I2KS60_9BACL|nr:metalloregulator ArsR/SmtB family transcription factor [Planifilum fulgidum]MBO2497183.1 ArsR family transcriptional regulator [Bacillota bacterium]MBO2531568.1 ArsR family transcriptional regulator [Thermoactinomycetaceae bacterium]SFF69882.1 DNA-binding transcriptional regulator, ArsR family [Planifilum fulgidum]